MIERVGRGMRYIFDVKPRSVGVRIAIDPGKATGVAVQTPEDLADAAFAEANQDFLNSSWYEEQEPEDDNGTE